ncbi:MAG: bifunctional folylpolyglutamate synthase/dihydrofolate synthase [Anaerolineales bacterium]|nr:bifunctional folylpolyglutamate synthase/dihydrofolate synthase [Anaerolineales bacterium]
MVSQRYQEALDYIYSFIDYSVERSYRYSADVFDLERVRSLLKAIGDPQHAYSTIHIAGTKGKGSVAAMIASVLQAAGYRTGLYTSPHLQRFPERIRVGGQEIAEVEVAQLVDTLKPHVAKVGGLTTYEIITALGFLYFMQREVDWAVIEVGLGGRLDATNVITPIVGVITSLSYDHMHLLGESLSDITREKAGIIKAGVPVVTAPQQFEVERVIEETAQALGAPLVRVGRDWLFSPGNHTLEGQSLYVWSSDEQPLMDAYVESAGDEEWAPPRYFIPLLGHHQVVNAAVAYAALQTAISHGVEIPEPAIRAGLRDVKWRGRFDILSRSPLVVVDSAHNRESALKLRIALDDYFPGQAVTLIFGASADKDISGMFTELLPRVSRLILTQAVHPRAADAEELADLAHSYGVGVEVIVPVSEALSRAMMQVDPEEVILATGSLFVAGEVLAAWERREASGSKDITREVR